MNFFSKKPISEPWHSDEREAPPVAAAPLTIKFGISDAIQLMRTLPTEHDGELVIRVVRATLASLNVRLPDIIEDATHRQKVTQDRITAVHGQIADLEKKLKEHVREIASLEADLRETTEVKERLEKAEKSAAEESTGPIPLADHPDTATRE